MLAPFRVNGNPGEDVVCNTAVEVLAMPVPFTMKSVPGEIP
jgi:hypothetical protein